MIINPILERPGGAFIRDRESDGDPVPLQEIQGEGAEAERVIHQYVRRGYNLIFTTSFGYMDPTINVAKRASNVVFMHCSGFKTAKNVGTYFGRMYQPRYLSGMVAGKMTRSNIVGYVAAHPIPEVIRGINAFTLRQNGPEVCPGPGPKEKGGHAQHELLR